MDFAILATEAAIKHEGDSDVNCSWCTWNNLQRILVDKSEDKINTIQNTKIIQNTEKKPGDLRKLDVILTLMKNHQLMLVWKMLRGVK